MINLCHGSIDRRIIYGWTRGVYSNKREINIKIYICMYIKGEGEERKKRYEEGLCCNECN